MEKKYKEEKRVFEKHMQKLYENEKEIYSFFKIEFWPKKGPCGTPHGQTKKKMKNRSKGDVKKGSAKGTEKKMVMDGVSL